MTKCSDPEMKNVVQEILNNITSAQHKYQAKHCQSRPIFPGRYGEDPLSGGTGMNKRATGGRGTSNVGPESECYTKPNTYMSYMQNHT
jgi:hypothetical protein